jgi:hypothetical protein
VIDAPLTQLARGVRNATTVPTVGAAHAAERQVA